LSTDDGYGTPPREGRVVPVFAFTRGRTRSMGQVLPLEAVVTTTPEAERHLGTLQAESSTIIRLCAQPLSIAEIGAHLRVPVGVARVLVGDLVNAGCLTVHMPQTTGREGGPSQAVLGRLLEELRAR
jgi:Protein of unknown function (DUF742)